MFSKHIWDLPWAPLGRASLWPLQRPAAGPPGRPVSPGSWSVCTGPASLVCSVGWSTWCVKWDGSWDGIPPPYHQCECIYKEFDGVIKCPLKGKVDVLNSARVTYLPFLMVFLPSRGSSTGSTDSPIFSISNVSPLDTAFSMTSK